MCSFPRSDWRTWTARQHRPQSFFTLAPVLLLSVFLDSSPTNLVPLQWWIMCSGLIPGSVVQLSLPVCRFPSVISRLSFPSFRLPSAPDNQTQDQLDQAQSEVKRLHPMDQPEQPHLDDDPHHQ